MIKYFTWTIYAAVIAGVLVTVASYGQAFWPAATVHDVAWFMAHPAELERTYAACRNSPGTAGAECINAGEAESQSMLAAAIKRAGG